MGKSIILPPGYADRYLQPFMGGSAVWRKAQGETTLSSVLKDIEKMDGPGGDPRVKKIHSKTAQYISKGGLALFGAEDAPKVQKIWDDFSRRVGLTGFQSQPKLVSHARQFVMSGNLALEVVTDKAGKRIDALLSRPPTSIIIHSDNRGRIIDAKRAYSQVDSTSGAVLAEFSLGQLILVRLHPKNYDDSGAWGRPMLDVARETWKKLDFSEDKLVERRASRASLRLAHIMEGASAEDLESYRRQIEADQYSGHDRDYYMNRKGAIQAISGDASLSDIADIEYLMDKFFAAAPAPSGLFGFGQKLSRDVLQELMNDFFEELDCIQEMLSAGYQEAFSLELALNGIDPMAYNFTVGYIEPNTLTPTQRADLGLKYQALGLPFSAIIRALGFSPADIQKLIRAEQADPEAYARSSAIQTNTGLVQPKVTITPRAAGREQSRTDISQ